ncbi:threonine synthase [Planctomycetales bacterium ZRK34]|nr:threonine synthase [Planctomycetales bacterium ZRK34]
MTSTYFSGLKCRECNKLYPADVRYVCEECFGPLEVAYDYDAIAKDLTRDVIESRGANMWRYKELLPVAGDVTVGPDVGFTPLVKADRLAEALGVREVWVKNDTVNYPTLSFKDRVVSVALTRAKEFGYETVGCASTGNLANSVAANAAAAGLRAFVIIPSDLEVGKILGSLIYGAHVVGVNGTYDNVNRLCSEIAGRYNWAFVNVNMRPYYAEGSKTMGYEIAEQLGWELPDAVVSPMAGGSLICKLDKAFKELTKLGFVKEHNTKIYGAQAEGCSPIVNMVKDEADWIKPVRQPNTIAKSLAIGDPADGVYAAGTMRNSGGWGENPNDEEVVAGIRLLAETTGIFAETAGGVTVGAAKRLIENGKIDRNARLVLCITGNGLKTKEAVAGSFKAIDTIKPSLTDFDSLLQTIQPEELPCQ